MTDPHDTPGEMPPHDELAERSVLGQAMSSQRALADAVALLTPDDFFLQRNVFVFTAIMSLSESGSPVDPVTVQAEIERQGKPGASLYVLELFQGVVTTANVDYHAKIIRDKAILRRATEVCQRGVQMVRESTLDASELVENIRQRFDHVAGGMRGAIHVHDIDDLVADQLASYQEPTEVGIRTGWPDLDNMLGGLKPGTLNVVAARPGVGKTVLGANIATHVARSGYGVLFMSLEMTRGELTDRILANLAGVELTSIREHRVGEHDMQRLNDAAEKLRGCPLRIVDLPTVGITGTRTIARDLTRTPRGLGLIVVDYLQLMKPSDARAPRQEQVAALSRGLKLLAKELLVPVVALAQVNRGPEGRNDKRPVISDLRESGAIEADADAIVLLHVDEENRQEIEVIVGKNRHGAKGCVSLAWAPYYARAGSLARHLRDVTVA